MNISLTIDYWSMAPPQQLWAGSRRARLSEGPGELMPEVQEGGALVRLHLPAHAHQVVDLVWAVVWGIHDVPIF